jgi:hypothetical protein
MPPWPLLPRKVATVDLARRAAGKVSISPAKKGG